MSTPPTTYPDFQGFARHDATRNEFVALAADFLAAAGADYTGRARDRMLARPEKRRNHYLRSLS